MFQTPAQQISRSAIGRDLYGGVVKKKRKLSKWNLYVKDAFKADPHTNMKDIAKAWQASKGPAKKKRALTKRQKQYHEYRARNVRTHPEWSKKLLGQEWRTHAPKRGGGPMYTRWKKASKKYHSEWSPARTKKEYIWHFRNKFATMPGWRRINEARLAKARGKRKATAPAKKKKAAAIVKKMIASDPMGAMQRLKSFIRALETPSGKRKRAPKSRAKRKAQIAVETVPPHPAAMIANPMMHAAPIVLAPAHVVRQVAPDPSDYEAELARAMEAQEAYVEPPSVYEAEMARAMEEQEEEGAGTYGGYDGYGGYIQGGYEQYINSIRERFPEISTKLAMGIGSGYERKYIKTRGNPWLKFLKVMRKAYPGHFSMTELSKIYKSLV